ncbi:hypothetical protein H0H92_009562 [Tricholoma furcatifolium]|nr:hypothetical protein H0H92_009562 [Tricholoma furcatifolium]
MSSLDSVLSDAYSCHHEGSVGENFALIKMRTSVGDCATDRESTSSKLSSNGVQSHDSNKSSQPASQKPLPDWLCSTFSSLAPKHPLRLLLPKYPAKKASTAVHPAIPSDQIHLNESEIDGTLVFTPSQQDISKNTRTNNGIISDMLVSQTSLRSAPLNPLLTCVDATRNHQAHSTTCYDADLDALSTGTRQNNMTPHGSQVNGQALAALSDFEDIGFIPFSTPGPGSILRSPPLSMQAQIATKFSADTEPSMTAHSKNTMPTSPAVDLTHSRIVSNELSSADLCLPPYNAAPSDPAPAYCSDGIINTSTSEQDCSQLPVHPQVIADLSNLFATPGPGYQPVYFDSPTEDPSDYDPLEPSPGFDIALNNIDFKWTPFDRKAIGEECNIAPGYIDTFHSGLWDDLSGPRPGAFKSTPSNFSETSLTSDCMPSPSPFRFSPPAALNYTIQDTEESIPVGLPFTPAPGIFVSPLRGEPDDSEASIPRTPEKKVRQCDKPTSHRETKRLPDTQTSDDSIQSWADSE